MAKWNIHILSAVCMNIVVTGISLGIYSELITPFQTSKL